MSIRARHGDRVEALADFALVLDGCRRHGNTVHAVTVLPNLVDLLCRLGDHHPAVVLLAALSGPEVRAGYGAEARRLENSMTAARRAVGTRRFERWWAEGAGLGLDGALAMASGLAMDGASSD